jgi:hypothetical protein
MVIAEHGMQIERMLVIREGDPVAGPERFEGALLGFGHTALA